MGEEVETLGRVNDRPLLVVKVGSPELLQGSSPWLPTEEDLQKVEDKLNELVGDRFDVFVYHAGVDVQCFYP